MKQLSKQHVLLIHEFLLDEFGGLSGLRDENMLESALNAPFLTFDGELLYPHAFDRAAKLAQGLIANHPFNDGNKRVGVTVMGVYLELEGYQLIASNNELIEFGLRTAQIADLQSIRVWIGKHCVPVK